MVYLAHAELDFGRSVTSTASCRVVKVVDVVDLPVPDVCDLADATPLLE
jgi:hypothetical protein